MKKTVRDLHEQYNQTDNKIKLNLVHKFDNKSRLWKFDGYRCGYCGSTFKYLSTIEKHPDTCRNINKNTRPYGEVNNEQIIDTSGKKWNPLYQQYSK